jgi:MFS family permease
VVLAAAQFVMVLDTAVMNVSLSQLVRDFDTDVATIQAAITLYSLVMAASMIVGAKLGDRWGRRRAFAIGIAVYGVGSATTALAPTVGVLIVGWSGLEGIGAALVLPALTALVASTYQGRDRALAFGVLGGVAGASVAVGPLLGGWVTDVASWRFVFAGEVLAVVGILGAVRHLPDPPVRAGARVGFDVPGAVLSAAGITLVVFGILRAGTWGWLVPRRSPVEPFGFAATPFVVAAGATLLAAFVAVERRREARGDARLVRLELLAAEPLRGALGTVVAQYLLLLGLFFTIPLYLQVVLGLDALDTGLRLLPVSLTMLAGAVSGPVIGRVASPRAIVRVGLAAVFAASVTLLASVGPTLDGGWFTVAMASLGLGMGLMASQVGNVVQSSVGEDDRSEVGGLQFTAQNLGGALGTALIGALVVGGLASAAAAGVAGDPRLSEPVRQPVGVAVAGGVSFVPAADVRAALEDARLPAVEVDALVERYEAAQLVGLRSAFLAVAALAMLTVPITRRLPDRPALAAPGPLAATPRLSDGALVAPHGDEGRRSARRSPDRPPPTVHTGTVHNSEQVIVDRLPDGPLTGSEFRLDACPVPEPVAGEVLIRVQALTIRAGQRAGLQGSASYAGAPAAGVVMGGTGAGVVEASAVPDIDVGATVVGPTGWRRHAALPAEQVRSHRPTSTRRTTSAYSAPTASPPTSACSRSAGPSRATPSRSRPPPGWSATWWASWRSCTTAGWSASSDRPRSAACSSTSWASTPPSTAPHRTSGPS